MPSITNEFIISIVQELERAGFKNTAREITLCIEEGRDGKELSIEEQQTICADFIEHNLIVPYTLWKKILEMRIGKEQNASEESFLKLSHPEGAQPLGSLDYQESIDSLTLIIGMIRPRPPSPKGSPRSGPPSGGGPPSFEPQPRRQPTPKRSDDRSNDGGGNDEEEPKFTR